MPLYIHLSNLVIKKTVITDKYTRDLDALKVALGFLDEYSLCEEDNELVSFKQMNNGDFNLEALVDAGFNCVLGERGVWHSDDFVIISRYGGKSWNAPWLEDNNVFFWHVACRADHKEEAVARGNCPMNEIETRYGWDTYAEAIR